MENYDEERGTGNGERGTGNGERGTENGERGKRNGEFLYCSFYGKLQEITQCNLSVTLLNWSNKC